MSEGRCEVCGAPAIGAVGPAIGLAARDAGRGRGLEVAYCGLQHRSASWARALGLDGRGARKFASEVNAHLRWLGEKVDGGGGWGLRRDGSRLVRS